MTTSGLPVWRTRGRWFRHGSWRLAYWLGERFAESDRPTLLLVHGFPTSSWDWHAVWPSLSARFRLVALDMLGFGLSDKPRRHAYAITEQADLHEALLAHLGLSRAHVLAHDYGDSVAQELLSRHEERRAAGITGGLALDSVCFLNGGLVPDLHRPRPIQRLLASPLGPLVSMLLSEARFRASFSRVFGPHTQPSERVLSESWTLLVENGGHRIAHRLIGYMAERRRHRDRWVGVLGATNVPLCLIDGCLDPVSGAHMVAAFRQIAPHAYVQELPDVGHYPQLEAPQAVLDAYRAWMLTLS